MGRRIYIIPECVKEENAIENAKRLNCPEIVSGVPPALIGIIDSNDLPIVYEEPEPTPAPAVRSLAEELDLLAITVGVDGQKIAELMAGIAECKTDISRLKEPQ